MNYRSLVLLSVLLAGCSTTKKAVDFESEFQKVTSLGVLPFQVKLHRTDMDTTKIDTAGEAAALISLKEAISGWNVHRTTSVDFGFSDPMQRLAYDSLCFAISREIYLSETIESVSMDSVFALRILDEKSDYAGGESNPRNKKSIAKYFSKVVKNFRIHP